MLKNKKSFSKTKGYRTTEKIEFDPLENEQLLFDNCWYRNWLYNCGINIIRHNEKQDGCIKFNTYEMINLMRDFYSSKNALAYNYDIPELKDYDYYARGIVETVVDDISRVCTRIMNERSLGNKSNLNLTRFNPNKQSFRIKNKINKSIGKCSNGLYTGNRLVFDENNGYVIGLKINKTYDYPIALKLYENVFSLMKKHGWSPNDIKEITIKFHNDKWFICLIIEYTLLHIRSKRKKCCGIDLGQTNPLVCFDGEKSFHEPVPFPYKRVRSLERRRNNLQRVLSRKQKRSKNYFKVLRKLHKVYERLTNVVKDWHFKLAHWIVTHYKNIVVDEFHNHIILNKDKRVPSKIKHIMNNRMYSRGMSIFIERLQHMCRKYLTSYLIPHQNFQTTNTCNLCGHENETKLGYVNYNRMSIFQCEKCKSTFARDENSAINCYNLFFLDKVISKI